jgi:hypothetical protein
MTARFNKRAPVAARALVPSHPRKKMKFGQKRRRHLRDRRPRAGHAPAMPAESRRRRLELVPSGDDVFNWRPLLELVEGPRPKRLGFTERLQALYGRGEPEPGA